MTEGLDDLRARVEAARERLAGDVALAQKVELRLNDLARIVEGSLARQATELETARQRIATVEADLARAVARAEQASGEASRAERLARENGELRSMVMALLEVVEGRQKSSLASVMQQLEESVSALVAPGAGSVLPPGPAAGDDGAEKPGPGSGSDAETGPAMEIDPDIMVDEETGAAQPPAGLGPDDLTEIDLSDAGDAVVEP